MPNPRILHLGIFNEKEPQWSLRKALKDISSEYHEYDWQTHRGNLNEMIIYYADVVDVIFMQIQCAGVILPETLAQVYGKVQVFNFTGDVRSPLPQWYIDIAPFCTSLFTNNTDVETIWGLGHEAVYFQVGYNTDFYTSIGDRYSHSPEIVFVGNHYQDAFPLSKLRYQLVQHLAYHYGDKFQVYGKGYPNAIDLNYKQLEEAKIYRSAKIGINCSHLDLKQYSSDRMFRIMACGCFCLTHRFKDIEIEFEDGVNIKTWETLEELSEGVDAALKNELWRKGIAQKGQELAESKYTWQYRMESQLLHIIKNNNGK